MSDQTPFEAIVVVDRPHPGVVVPGSVRDLYENGWPEPAEPTPEEG